MRNLQNALRDFDRVRIMVMVMVRFRVRLGLGSRLGQKFAHCTRAISKLRSAFCKLHRLTNRGQHKDEEVGAVGLYDRVQERNQV